MVDGKKKRVLKKTMTGFKHWDICVVPGSVRGVPNRNYIEENNADFRF